MKTVLLLVVIPLAAGCLTTPLDHRLRLHVEGRLVSCVDDLPLEGVNIWMNVATNPQTPPLQFLHTLSDSSGMIDADVTLQYAGRVGWRSPARNHAPDVDYEFMFDLEGYAPQHLRVPAPTVTADDVHVLQLGQICLEPSASDSTYLLTGAPRSLRSSPDAQGVIAWEQAASGHGIVQRQGRGNANGG